MEGLDEIEDKLKEALRRDTNHILGEAAGRKLPPSSARDLVAYLKLAAEIRAEEEKAAKALPKMSEEELRAYAEKLLK